MLPLLSRTHTVLRKRPGNKRLLTISSFMRIMQRQMQCTLCRGCVLNRNTLVSLSQMNGTNNSWSIGERYWQMVVFMTLSCLSPSERFCWTDILRPHFRWRSVWWKKRRIIFARKPKSPKIKWFLIWTKGDSDENNEKNAISCVRLRSHAVQIYRFRSEKIMDY